MKIQAILFDLDGTLLDTLADLADAMNASLDKMGFPVHERSAYKYFVGDGVGELARRALPEASRKPATIKLCLDAMRQYYGRNWAQKTAPYPHVSELLAAVSGQGMALAVLSNKPHDLVGAMIKHFFPEISFGDVRGLKEGTPRKPDPFAALAIARKTGKEPEEFIYLGDTNTDMQTAKAAGMKAVGALWGFRTKEELINNGAEIVIQDPLDLLNILSL